MNSAMAITFGLAHRLDKTTVKGMLVLRQPRINYRYASLSSQEVLKKDIFHTEKCAENPFLYSPATETESWEMGDSI